MMDKGKNEAKLPPLAMGMRKNNAMLSPLTLFLAFVSFFIQSFDVCAGNDAFKDYAIEVSPTPNSIFWLNDNQLVFKGLVPINESRPTQFSGKRIGKLAMLDLNTGQVEWFGEFTGELCVDAGKVVYSSSNRIMRTASEQDRYWITRGAINDLMTREISREELQAFDFYMSCKPSSELLHAPSWMEAAKKEGRLFKRLRPEHGWVELGKTQNAGSLPSEFPIRLYQPGANELEGIVIRGVEDKDLQSNWVYYRFKDAYRLEPRGSGAMAWWFYPDGRIEVSPRMGIPVRKGFIFNVVQPSKSWVDAQTNPSGLYFRRTETESIKLVAGFTNSPFGFAISPDGCRVAFGTDKDLSQSIGSRFKLQIIDVCLANSGTKGAGR